MANCYVTLLSAEKHTQENKMNTSKRVTIKDLVEEIKESKVKTQEFDNLKNKIADLKKEIQSLKNKNGYTLAESASEL